MKWAIYPFSTWFHASRMKFMKFENGEPTNFPVYSGNATTD